jgi:adenylosuccinate lyase
VELRHLQRTEVGEVIEDFSPGQKGSSAMPHKKNPIGSENITGAARLLRSYLMAGLENMALWHERDISHSSVERVILPDAFIICDYALHRMAEIVSKLHVDKDRMKSNMDLSKGQLFSSQVLLLLVKKGLSREEAYALVQELSHGLKPGEHLRARLLKDPRVKKRATKSEIESLYKETSYKDRMKAIVARAVR